MKFLGFLLRARLWCATLTLNESVKASSHFLGDLHEQFSFGVRQLPADRHQAAVGREPQFVRLDVFERGAHALDDFGHRRHRRIARIDGSRT